MDLDGLPARIEALRADRGLSQIGLCEAAGLDKSARKALFWSHPIGRPYLDLFAAIAPPLRILPSHLLGRWEAPTPPPPIDAFELDLTALDRAIRRALYELRSSLKFGEHRAAKMTGVPQSWICRVETGVLERLNLIHVDRYCRGLDTDPITIIERAEQAAIARRAA